jgi:hypothetical protein
MKRLWRVRLGKNGEFESDALNRSLLSIGFPEEIRAELPLRCTWTLVLPEDQEGSA